MQMMLDIRRGMFGPQLTAGQARDMEEAYQQLLKETRLALREHAHIVEALVALLLEKEELLGQEVRAFFDQYGLYTPEPEGLPAPEFLSAVSEPVVVPVLQPEKERQGR
jgi:hypothetical protein